MSNHLDERGTDGERTLSAVKLALLARQIRKEIEGIEVLGAEPIAIVGMGCRFPGGADSLDGYWRMLAQGMDAIGEVPRDRWDLDAWFDPDPETPGRVSTRYGGFLDHVDRFDPEFFGISPREVREMDPQQRLLLEVTWEALENAAVPPSSLAGTATGVFVGVVLMDFAIRLFADPARLSEYTISGTAHSIAANRLSYLLDLRGPSVAVDTACSSSLVATHLACQSLRTGESNLAIVGGVNVLLSPISTIPLSKARIMAPDGRCKTFDAAADGYVRGEGCGVLVLKRLADALADRDPIHAVIRGTASCQDGRSNGLSAPNMLAQQHVIRQALANGRVRPEQVGLVEAHGTGTALGDPIEVQALRAAYGTPRAPEARCAVSSVKTNFGHLEGAAGVAGLIKAALCLAHEAIPPHLHLRRINPDLAAHVSAEGASLYIPTSLQPWPRGQAPRFAATSSFGVGGAIVHVVLEEAPVLPRPDPARGRPAQLLTLSARDPAALRDLAAAYARHLEAHPEQALADVAFTSHVGRTHHEHRLALMAGSGEEMRPLLAAAAADALPPGAILDRAGEDGRLDAAFLFGDESAVYAGMGSGLHAAEPVFREALERCEALLGARLERPLLSILYPVPDASVNAPGAAPGGLAAARPAHAQPALVAVQLALAALWRSWGMEPRAVLGCGAGELAAACVAGAMEWQDALALAAARGALAEAAGRDGHGQEARAAREALAAVAAGIVHRPPRIAFVSGLHGRVCAALDAAHWQAHADRPARVGEALDALIASGRANASLAGGAGGLGAFLELGPRPALVSRAREALGARAAGDGDRAPLWLSSLHQGRDDVRHMLAALGQLHARGARIDWAGFHRDAPRRRVVVPTYPFQRERYWFEEEPSGPAPVPAASGHACVMSWPVQALPEVQPEQPERRPGTWLVLADRGGVGQSLAERLRARGGRAIVVHAGAAPAQGGGAAGAISGAPAGAAVEATVDSADMTGLPRLLDELDRPALDGVVYLWSLDIAPAGEAPARAGGPASAPVDDIDVVPAPGIPGLLGLLRAVEHASKGRPPRLWLVTRGAQRVAGETALAVTQAPLWGVGRVIAVEHPELWGGLVDLEPGQDPARERDADALLAELLAPRPAPAAGAGRAGSPVAGDQVAYRAGARHAARLVPAGAPAGVAFTPRADATYLIAGGLGALGLHAARWLVERGARSLVLVSRRPPPDPVAEVLRALAQRGARIVVEQGDVSRRDDLARVLDRVAHAQPALPPLRGVIHAAGTTDDGLLRDQSPERFARLMASKVAGAWNLHVLTRGLALDVFALFSSLSSLFGAAGLGSYAAANAFLDGLAQHRRARGLPALSVNWGPWEGHGMATRAELAEGFALLAPGRALDALGAWLGADQAQVMVADIDWPRFLDIYPAGLLPPVLIEMAARARRAAPPAGARGGQAGAAPAAELRDRLLQAAPEDREALATAHVLGEVSRILGFPAERVAGSGKGFFDLGMDSLMAVKLRNRLQADLGQPLPASLIFNFPTAPALARRLLAMAMPGAPGDADAPADPAREPPPARTTPGAASAAASAGSIDDGAVLAAVESLSEDETLAALSALADQVLEDEEA